MSDNQDQYWEKFFETRSKPLWERFPGRYRALVVETDDPLRMQRVRFKCPDLHDWNLPDRECPWAVPSFDLGSKRHGRWAHPCRGDWVWIAFERGHPYGPVWVGFATPTRRKYYPYPSLSGPTPVPVDDKGRAQSAPQDYNPAYLPRDHRPMSHGWQDRYGSLDLHSATGFYPAEHAQAPPPPDSDAVQGGVFQQAGSGPQVNQPDLKYQMRVTKYGQMLLLGDQGYWWQRQGEYGEFSGDCDQDEQFEIARWNYLQRLANEGKPDSARDGVAVPFGDQRRSELKNRYGSRLELRDTGWAQPGPIPSKSRAAEYGSSVYLSRERQNDFRWVKLRTKGGFLLQAYDKGFHPQEDRYIRRTLLDECGHLSEREDKHWASKDARWFRMSTRYGIKLVLDDRGSDPREAQQRESPRGNGFLVKGRRSGAAHAKLRTSDPRGFSIEFNENDELNRMLMCSPLGWALELNDRYEYMMLCSSLGRGYPSKWRGLAENEFNLHPTRQRQAELKSYHLLLDHENELLRLKTRAGMGPKPDHVVNPSGVSKGEVHQGLECHDGSQGQGPWVELVDSQSRGFWLARNHALGVWRGRAGTELMHWIDDGNRTIVIFNNEDDGKVQIYSAAGVEVMGAGDVRLYSEANVQVKAEGDIRLHAGGTKFTIAGAVPEVRTNAQIIFGGDSADTLEAPEPPRVVEPDDRGKAYNEPFQSCPQEEVEHPLEEEQ